MFHGTRHNQRYWNIVLGKWLQRYLTVAFNRYYTLEDAFENYDISGTLVFDHSNYNLATDDSLSFIWACNDDIWNHVFYAKILQFNGFDKLDTDQHALDGFQKFGELDSTDSARRTIKQKAMEAMNSVLPKFSRSTDAFIINSYLPKIEELKLQASLGQMPQLWKSPPVIQVGLGKGERNKFTISHENFKGFKKFVRMNLGDVIPICFLEGYQGLVRQAGTLSWPTQPKFVFTSNNFDTDEIFKVWVGSKAEQGTSYFIGQHGNNYGTLAGCETWPEMVTCDKFITWGWTNNNTKNIPAFIFKTVNCPLKNNPIGGLLLIELCVPHRIDVWDNYWEFCEYQKDQFDFVTSLRDNIRQQLTVRLHQGYKKMQWSDLQRWGDFDPNVKIDTGTTPINNLIANNRLVVHSYDSTGILETLSLNIPTICFWKGNFEHLLPIAKPNYDLLRKAGIFVEEPAAAADLISDRWDNVLGWWNSKIVQQCRMAFCNIYARRCNNPLSTMRKLLTMPRLVKG